VTPCSPNLNAGAERFVQTTRRECLKRFVFFGEGHQRHVLREFLTWYHEARPHQSLGNVPSCGPPPEEGQPAAVGEVVCEEQLGGPLKHYRRAA
jgi:transposase InsO family protein